MSNIFDLFKKIEKTKNEPAPITHIIVGLGNPGAKYENTRHNAGFIAIDAIAKAHGIAINRQKFHALVGEGTIGGARVLLMKPETFMNSSGVAIREAALFSKITAENIIVLHDEISFDPGIIRIRRKGSAGGHNGLKSIIAEVGSQDFPRIKIGVGQKPHPDYDLVDWVLGRFTSDDRARIAERIPDITEAVELIIAGKIDEAMNRYSK
jgi:PTH1 family peptidyl-tRNA hydrolase